MPRALSLVIPEGLVVIAAVVLARFGAGIGGFAQVAEWLPWLLFVGGAGFAWRFRRGRLLAGLIALLPWWSWISYAPDADWQLPLLASSALSLVAIGWSRERGLSGRYVPILLLSLAGGALWAWLGAAPADATRYLDPIAGVGLAALVVATLVRADGLAQGALWALIGVWALLGDLDHAGRLILVAGAAAALVTGTLESIFAAAYRDALTGLPSRRALDERLAALPAGVVLAMVDVDHFKQFNDTYGHETGDQVLRMVAWRLAEVRDAEAFRYGGEEFTLIFPGLALPEALKRMEEARLAIAASKFALRAGDRPKGKEGRSRRAAAGKAHGLSVTVSMGAALRGEGEHGLALVKRADEALYRAKEAGRDRVIAAK